MMQINRYKNLSSTRPSGCWASKEESGAHQESDFRPAWDQNYQESFMLS